MTREKGITIRNAEKNDIPALLDVLRQTGLYFPPIDDFPDAYETAMDHDPESIIVAEASGIVVGIAVFFWNPLLSVLAHLAVLEEYRRRGIATLLLEEALQKIARRGSAAVSAYLVEANTASRMLSPKMNVMTFPEKMVCCYVPMSGADGKVAHHVP